MNSITGESILRVSDLRVDLEGKTILKNVSFELSENETLAILGPNGAGKSVLLKALLGILPHQGEIVWKEGVKVGYVPQRIPLNTDLPLTVGDFFQLKGLSEKTTSMMLNSVGLIANELSKVPLGILSSGQFQRVLIAWALSKEPNVILFDEPTAGVDVHGEETIRTLLSDTRSKRNLAVILVTHDLNTAYTQANHVLRLISNTFCYGSPHEFRQTHA